LRRLAGEERLVSPTLQSHGLGAGRDGTLADPLDVDADAPDPAAVTRFEPWVSRDGEAYAYSLDRVLNSLYVLENVR